MSTNVMELMRWLNTLNPLEEVAIDEGGLYLRAVFYDKKAYLEVGGMPECDCLLCEAQRGKLEEED